MEIESKLVKQIQSQQNQGKMEADNDVAEQSAKPNEAVNLKNLFAEFSQQGTHKVYNFLLLTASSCALIIENSKNKQVIAPRMELDLCRRIINSISNEDDPYHHFAAAFEKSEWMDIYVKLLYGCVLANADIETDFAILSSRSYRQFYHNIDTTYVQIFKAMFDQERDTRDLRLQSFLKSIHLNIETTIMLIQITDSKYEKYALLLEPKISNHREQLSFWEIDVHRVDLKKCAARLIRLGRQDIVNAWIETISKMVPRTAIGYTLTAIPIEIFQTQPSSLYFQPMTPYFSNNNSATLNSVNFNKIEDDVDDCQSPIGSEIASSDSEDNHFVSPTSLDPSPHRSPIHSVPLHSEPPPQSENLHDVNLKTRMIEELQAELSHTENANDNQHLIDDFPCFPSRIDQVESYNLFCSGRSSFFWNYDSKLFGFKYMNALYLKSEEVFLAFLEVTVNRFNMDSLKEISQNSNQDDELHADVMFFTGLCKFIFKSANQFEFKSAFLKRLIDQIKPLFLITDNLEESNSNKRNIIAGILLEFAARTGQKIECDVTYLSHAIRSNPNFNLKAISIEIGPANQMAVSHVPLLYRVLLDEQQLVDYCKNQKKYLNDTGKQNETKNEVDADNVNLDYFIETINETTSLNSGQRGSLTQSSSGVSSFTIFAHKKTTNLNFKEDEDFDSEQINSSHKSKKLKMADDSTLEVYQTSTPAPTDATSASVSKDTHSEPKDPEDSDSERDNLTPSL